MLKLRRHSGGRGSLPPRVESSSVVIGRSTKCDVSIPDRFLSRRHAQVSSRMVVTVGWWRTSGPATARYVNGRRIERGGGVRAGDVLDHVRQPDQARRRGRATTPPPPTSGPRPASDVLPKTSTPPPIDRAEDSARSSRGSRNGSPSSTRSIRRWPGRSRLGRAARPDSRPSLRAPQTGAGCDFPQEPGRQLRACSRPVGDGSCR